MVGIAALFHDLGVECAFQLADLELEIGLDFGGVAGLGSADGVLVFPAAFPGGVLGRGGFFLRLVGDGDDFHLPGVVAGEIDLVDHRIEGVVVGAEGLEDLPDDFVNLVVVQGFVRLHAHGDDDGKDDVAALFPRCIPHDAADGLDDIDLGIPGSEEEHGIERRDIDALG